MSFVIDDLTPMELSLSALDDQDNSVAKIDAEIASVMKAYNELLEVYTSIKKQSEENHEIYETEISKIKKQIAETDKKTKKLLAEQEEEQNRVRAQFTQDSINQINYIRNKNEVVHNEEIPDLKKEVQNLEVLDEAFAIQTQINETQVVTAEEENYSPEEPDNAHEVRYSELMDTIDMLRSQISSTQQRTKTTSQEIDQQMQIRAMTHEQIMERLRQEDKNRDREYKKHLDIVQQLVESERNHTLEEVKSVKNCTKSLIKVRSKITREYAKKIQTAFRDIKIAEKALEKAHETEASFQDSLSSSGARTVQDSTIVDSYIEEESALTAKLENLQTINKKAFQILNEPDY